MSTPSQVSCVEQIGQTAGLVWKVLVDHGPMSTAKLTQAVDVPRDVVMQAIGWLAREDKVAIEEKSRSRVVSLR
ncbi:MAG: winged helix-turn-helix domain-containing protein [Pirellulales bacterium]